MPNHVTNRVELFGEKSEINRLLKTVKDDEFGLGSIDFNKIIPMPEDIADTYNWCISNWGTKWNSYGYSKGSDHRLKNVQTMNEGEIPEIRFLTAWSAPHPILEKLSEMFPAVKISHEWADEDIGYNCGRREYYGGERTEEYYPDHEKESIEFAAKVTDVQLEEDLGLYLNASETGYINIEGDDEYERIELFGKPALFTNDRITDADIPKGMYCYHIRHGDDGNFCALEKRVAVNHAGSVVTKGPIDLGKNGFIAFSEDNSPNFLGEIMSLYMFREYDGEQSEDEDMGMEMNQ